MSVQFPLLLLLLCGLSAIAFGHFSVLQVGTPHNHTELVCSKDTFACVMSGRCIPLSWRCDTEPDCLGGEDEENCEQTSFKCNPTIEFRCSEPAGETLLNARLLNIHGAGALFSHQCIPKEWQCDGEADCINKDDEKNCEKINCDNSTHFQCAGFENDAISCIPLSWVCDGQIDCVDMSDEKNCSSLQKNHEQCENNDFQCKEGSCIYSRWRCDGEADCIDGSDEEHCDSVEECQKFDKFKCVDGPCIPSSWRCDGEVDCPGDHSDELNCTEYNFKEKMKDFECSDKKFKCKNSLRCINALWVCDGDADCSDKSDEEGCKELHCAVNEQLCGDGKQCVATNTICNGKKECDDGSDEENCPVIFADTEPCDTTDHYKCDEQPSRCIKYVDLCIGNNDCAKTVCNKPITNCNMTDRFCNCHHTGMKGGLVCYCKEGFKSVGGKCEDINECEKPGTCHQICTNTMGGYICDCYPGYRLTIGKEEPKGVAHKCRVVGDDPQLLLSNRMTIRQYDLYTNKYYPLISSLESAVALDYWHKNKTLIWSDVSKEQIMICHMGNKTVLNTINDCLDHGNVTLISENVTTPDGLAIDWVHGLLFWTDTGLDMISVFDLNTKKRKVLFDNGLDEPRAIVVDPSAGLIFWSDWGKEARIERAGMDGQNRIEIVRGDAIKWPNGLALDILDRRLYWADAKLKMISSCDYWGKNVRTVLRSHDYLRHPFSLAVFEEKLYWTDWDHEGVLSVNKFNGQDVKALMKGVTGPMTVRVYHQQAQPDHPNKCEFNDCDHLCLPRAHISEALEANELGLRGLSYSCACDIGFKIGSDNSSVCIPLNFLSERLPTDESSRLSLVYFVLMLTVIAVLIVAFTQYRQRPSHFAVLHFDNPIYRRTVEDLDADMENPPDNSLGAISTLPVSNLDIHNNMSSSQSAASLGVKNSESSAKLILSGVNGGKPSKVQNGSVDPSVTIDLTDPTQYAYDQQPRV